jgi:hypothetical protein
VSFGTLKQRLEMKGKILSELTTKCVIKDLLYWALLMIESVLSRLKTKMHSRLFISSGMHLAGSAGI